MFFVYPIAATSTNWLHECLAEILNEGMNNVDAGNARTPWPDCIAVDRRDRLRRFSQLQEYLDEFFACYESLAQDERSIVREAVDDQSAPAVLFEGGRNANRLIDLPEPIRESAKQVFEKAFDMLKPLGIRDENYKKFFRSLDHKVCAFCGCEHFSGATSKREPLDHYLAISLYPFAGANARNLVPMGAKCNSSYKLAQDVLRTSQGVRRVCFDPYEATPVRVNLMASQLFARDNGLPSWQIHLEGDADRIRTWNEVFDITRRFTDDHLDSIYKNAIKVFGALWRKRPQVLPMDATVAEALEHLADLSRAKGWSDRAFLETALYEMLQARCTAGGPEAERVIAELSSAALVT